MPTRPTITLHSHWLGKQTQVEVVVTRVTVREVSYMAVDCSISGTLPQWPFLQDFQPLIEQKKKGAEQRRTSSLNLLDCSCPTSLLRV